MIKIRRALAVDTADVIDLIHQLETTYEWPVTHKERNIGAFEEYIDNGQYIVFVAEDEQQQFQGILTLSSVIAFYAEGEMGMIHELYVNESHRAAGLASQLMNAAKNYAEMNKWQMLELSTPRHANNERAKAFYLKEGFEDFGIHYTYETSHCGN